MDHARGNGNISPIQTHLHQRRTGGKVNLYVAGEQSGPAGRTRQIDRFDLQAVKIFDPSTLATARNSRPWLGVEDVEAGFVAVSKPACPYLSPRYRHST